VALVVDTDIVENLYHPAGKPTLGEIRGALHEEHDVVALHFIVDEIVDAAHKIVLFAVPGSRSGCFILCIVNQRQFFQNCGADFCFRVRDIFPEGG
jgi:hypothetical protein